MVEFQIGLASTQYTFPTQAFYQRGSALVVARSHVFAHVLAVVLHEGSLSENEAGENRTHIFLIKSQVQSQFLVQPQTTATLARNRRLMLTHILFSKTAVDSRLATHLGASQKKPMERDGVEPPMCNARLVYSQEPYRSANAPDFQRAKKQKRPDPFWDPAFLRCYFFSLVAQGPGPSDNQSFLPCSSMLTGHDGCPDERR